MVSSVHSAHCSHLVICKRAHFQPSSGFTSAAGSLSLWSASGSGSSCCYHSGDDTEELNIPWSCTDCFVFHFLFIHLLFLLVILFSGFLFFGMYLVFHCFIPWLMPLSASLDDSSSVQGLVEHLVLLDAVHRRAVLQQPCAGSVGIA